jgi:thiol-disulfide isomerase/thioredoxin
MSGLLILLVALTFAQKGQASWQSYLLRDSRTGEVFTLGSYEGKTVFVEGMATCCGHCLQQLRSVALVKEQLPVEEYVFIALSVDTNAKDEELVSYANKEGFDWAFAVVPPEFLIDLATVFGQKFTRPLSHFIIRADRSFSSLDIGVKSPDELLTLLIEATLEQDYEQTH